MLYNNYYFNNIGLLEWFLLNDNGIEKLTLSEGLSIIMRRLISLLIDEG